MRGIVVVVLTAALAGGVAGPAAAKEVVRARDGNRFAPKRVQVSKGEKVVWKNVDNIAHNVVPAGDGWSGFTLQPGERKARTFGKKGTYRYDCTLHAGMEGRVVVG
jgi:plastocyanin